MVDDNKTWNDPKPNQDGQDETVTLSKTELEKYKQLEKSYKDSQKEGQLRGHLKKTKEDNSYLADLAKKDKKMAESVADFWWMSLDEALKKLWWKDEKLDKDELYKEFKDRQEKERAESVFSKFLKEKNLDEWSDFYKDFKEEFDDYMEWKKRTKSRVEKATSYALSQAKKVSKFAEEYNKVNAKKIGFWWRESTPWKKTNWILESFYASENKHKERLKKHNLLKKD